MVTAEKAAEEGVDSVRVVVRVVVAKEVGAMAVGVAAPEEQAAAKAVEAVEMAAAGMVAAETAAAGHDARWRWRRRR